MSKKLKKIIARLALVIMVLGAFATTDVKSYASYNSDVSEGVAVIAEYVYGATYFIIYNGQPMQIQESYDGLYATGTCFFVGEKGDDPQYVVTNCHCVQDFIDGGEGSEGYFETYYEYEGYPVYMYFERFELRVYYSENDYDLAFVVDAGSVEKIDLALLRLEGPTDKRKPLAISVPDEDKMVGEPVYSVGYPGIAENELSAASKWKVTDVDVQSGSVNRFVTANNGVKRIEMDAKINHGNSGGPLVDEKGNVIGVNTNGWTEDTDTRYYAISTYHVKELLDKNAISYISGDKKGKGSSDDEDDEDSNLTLIFIIAGIAAVVVIAIIVVVVVVSSSKKKSAVRVAPQMPTPGQVPMGNRPPMPGQAPMGMPGSPNPMAAQAPKKASIRSMSTQHNGVSIPLNNAPVMIGRDPSCVIRFKEGTAGVSGRHAQVQFDQASGDFLITDLRSSYGTYLLNGQRLEANVPYHLKAGESFYVGDKANIIRVEIG